MIRKINVGSGTCCNYAKKGRDLAIQFAYGTIKAKHLRNKNSLSLKNIKSDTKEVIVYRIIFSWNVIDGFYCQLCVLLLYVFCFIQPCSSRGRFGARNYLVFYETGLYEVACRTWPAMRREII